MGSEVILNRLGEDALDYCQMPDCIGKFRFSNVHKPSWQCDMNENGTPTGCNQPEQHHKFVEDLNDVL